MTVIEDDWSMQNKDGEEKTVASNAWIFPAFLAAFLFFLCDSQLTIITSQVQGMETWFYISSGAIFCGFGFNVGKTIKLKKWNS